jgi:Carboxypeptidase regulatory-like domain
MRIGCRVALIVLAAGLLPAIASAQGAITGVVRDTSGAILPGVTIEASSPALIERVRSAVTDSSGQYRIEDLRPGSYVVTFTLAGFSTVRREGIELTGSLAALVNVELRVWALE